MDVKSALRDGRFRKLLPREYDKDLTKFLANPTCPCNISFYRSILTNCKDQLMKYFPNREVVGEKNQLEEMMKNNWTVINCNVNELDGRLRKLPKGRKQLAITRYEDQVTVVVNELDMVF